MKRWFRNSLIGLGAVLALAAAVVVGAAQYGERKMQRQVPLGDVAAPSLAALDDATRVERGRYLFLSRGCTECHGVNGAGKVFIDDGHGMRARAPNITPIPGGVVAAYGEADWARTLRHGVKPDGRPLMIMPSEDYARLTDADLAAMVAFLRQMPAQLGERAELSFPLAVKALYGLGLIGDAASKIDHSLPPQQPVPEAITAEHGRYVANACMGCHGAQMAGGRIAGAPPDWPAAANLTPAEGSAMQRYPDAQAFAAMLHSGRRPDGSEVSKVMPFLALKELNDTDVQALYLHLKALPAVARN